MTERIQLYNAGRVVISLGLLGLTVTAGARGEWTDAIARMPIYPLIATQLLLLIACIVWSKFRKLSTIALYTLFAWDVGVASLLSAWTGGTSSLLIFLYFPVIAAGAYLLGRRGALVVALFCFIGQVGVGMYAQGDSRDALLLYLEIGFRVMSFLLVGILSGQLAESLERTGKELQFQRVTSETVLARVQAGVLIIDRDDRIAEVNANGRILLGEIVGKRITEVFSGAVHHRAWEESTPESRRLVCSQATLPAEERVIVVEDVTELWEMRQRAERDDRLVGVGRLAAALAHEIRNPLASITSVLQILREDGKNRQVDLALGEAERLSRLVTEFLEAARAPSIQRTPTDLAALTSEAVDAFGNDPRFGGTRVVVEAQVFTADVDRDRLRQVLWNLLRNAAEAMPEGGTICVRVTRDLGQAVIEVEDHGRGILASELPRIFDPFFTRRAGGTGLGLALVDQIVRLHGGVVAARSVPGSGTTITLHLPVGASE